MTDTLETTGPDTAKRIAALDLVRGVAVLGIHAVNIAGFAGPPAATYTPRAVLPADPVSDWTFAVMLVLFEGKMRALFSMLFGASMLLFVERVEERGGDGQTLQLRRLGWLALFGYLHFVLLWWGDILFLYAVVGVVALALREMRPRGILAAALIASLVWQAQGMLDRLPSAIAEHHIGQGHADPAETARYRKVSAAWQDRIDEAMQDDRLGFVAQVANRLSTEPFEPVRGALLSAGETLPYMLVGMLLHMSGFFTGAWPRARLRKLAWLGIGLGGVPNLAFAGWALAHGFPKFTMLLAINFALTLPHWLMALGYAAMLVLHAPRMLASGLGQRLQAAGQVALSNYLATSIVMTGLFHGWGLGLGGRLPYAVLPMSVFAAWIGMLWWSTAWRRHFRQGPLEWLWRCLTEGRLLPLRQ